MGMRALRQVLGALAGPAVVVCFVASGCEPQDIYLFDEPAASDEGREDAGSYEPEPDAETPEVETPQGEQPACTSEACEQCVARADCRLDAADLFCHPETGACKLPCDAEASAEERTCPASERCDARIELCVECVVDADCGGGPLAACDRTRGECVECLDSSTCPSERRTCDVASSRCVGCLVNADCAATGELCLLGEQRCVQCRDDGDCSALDDDNLCLLGEQRCVECVDDGDCTADPRRPFCSSERECEDERE
jgi:hypothetical protein